jgi:hypothetical protein
MRRFKTSSLLLAAICTALPSAIAAVALPSCGNNDSAPSTDDGATGVVGDARKTPADDAPADDDAGIDAADAYVAPVNLPPCVGMQIPMILDGVRAFADISIGSLPEGGGYSATGPFVVDFGSTGSSIDLNGFDGGAPQPVSCAGDASAPGADCQFNGFDFFGNWGTVYLITADYSVLFGSLRQAGIVATDFLSLNPVSLDFTHKQIFRSDPKAFCTDTQLLGSGFRPLPAQGFYTNDFSKLRPLSEVIDNPDATAGYVVPNVPTVPITIAGTAALAQLDTGYEDRLSRRSLNVNEALFTLLTQQPGLLMRNPDHDLFVTTCVPGYSEKLEAYMLTTGNTLEFIGEGGAVVRTDPAEAVYLKRTQAKTYPCGGISTWTVPAAQVGASFFIDAQAIVMDPITSRVWVPKN